MQRLHYPFVYIHFPLVHFQVSLQSAFLRESPPAHRAREPLVVIVYPHVLPKRFLPLVRLTADRARVYPLPVVLYHVHL